jgi:hypothetical protein
LSIPPPKLNPVLDLEGLLPKLKELLAPLEERSLDEGGGEKMAGENVEFDMSSVVLGERVPFREGPAFERRRPSLPKKELL